MLARAIFVLLLTAYARQISRGSQYGPLPSVAMNVLCRGDGIDSSAFGIRLHDLLRHNGLLGIHLRQFRLQYGQLSVHLGL